MKPTIAFFAALLISATVSAADSDIIVLDLTKSTTPLAFDADNGSWNGTFEGVYGDDLDLIDSQIFSFVHRAWGNYQTWWGFTASNSADNTRPADTMSHQWSNMAAGGIVLADDGTVALDSHGAPLVSADVPYMIGYYGSYFGERSCQMVFSDGKCYRPIGVYVNLTSWAYYTVEYGDAFANAFSEGDRFVLTVHGVAEDESEKTVDVEMATYTNGNLTINRGWRYVDLGSLGAVNELYFTMSTTDMDAYGYMNTPCFFALDKLMVRPDDNSGIAQATLSQGIRYDRATATITLADDLDFMTIHDVSGHQVASCHGKTFDIARLDRGIYVVHAGNNTLKILR